MRDTHYPWSWETTNITFMIYDKSYIHPINYGIPTYNSYYN